MTTNQAYVLLLIRTFLTLEGISARVDPDFNIYEMALPWAVRRSLSPSTTDGIHALRSTILTNDNRIQWDRFMGLVNDAITLNTKNATSVNTLSENNSKEKASQQAKKIALNDAVLSLLGSPNGVYLRKVLKDLDSTDLIRRLNSKEASNLRIAMAHSLVSVKDSEDQKNNVTENMENVRPTSDESLNIRQNKDRWKRKVTFLLVKRHLIAQLRRGPKATILLISLAVRIGVRALRQKIKLMLQNITLMKAIV